jgi:hypothetical protein
VDVISGVNAAGSCVLSNVSTCSVENKHQHRILQLISARSCRTLSLTTHSISLPKLSHNLVLAQTSSVPHHRHSCVLIVCMLSSLALSHRISVFSSGR